MLLSSKYTILAQVIGNQSLRIQSITNGYDKNVSGIFFASQNKHHLKIGANLYTNLRFFTAGLLHRELRFFWN